MKRRILGITVISAGVCAALPFRNDTNSGPIVGPEPVESLGSVASRDELTLQLSIPASAAAGPAARPAQPIDSAAASASTSSRPQEVRRDQLQAPPSIAAAFEPLAATSGSETFPVAAESTVPHLEESIAGTTSSSQGESVPEVKERQMPHHDVPGTDVSESDAPQRRHRVVDGDTLERLAEKYLGDRTRWRLIFQANASLLTEPNLLPIGAEILIPQSPPTEAKDPDDHLVPIPPGVLNREAL